MACTATACLVCLVLLLVAAAKKKKKCCASSGHTTKLEQSISLDIYGSILYYNIKLITTAITFLIYWSQVVVTEPGKHLVINQYTLPKR
jgi:hypothetical protein